MLTLDDAYFQLDPSQYGGSHATPQRQVQLLRWTQIYFIAVWSFVCIVINHNSNEKLKFADDEADYMSGLLNVIISIIMRKYGSSRNDLYRELLSC